MSKSSTANVNIETLIRFFIEGTFSTPPHQHKARIFGLSSSDYIAPAGANASLVKSYVYVFPSYSLPAHLLLLTAYYSP